MILLAATILLTSCGAPKDSDGSRSAELSALPESASSGSSAVPEAEGVSIRELLLRGKSGSINAVVYMDSCSIWLKAAHADLELSAYEPELIAQYESALDKVRIEEASVELLSDRPDLSQFPEFLDFEVPIGEGNEYIEHFIPLPDGTVFFSEFYAGPQEEKYYRCNMTDPAQYTVLRADMEAIKKQWKENVEYSLYVAISPKEFKPESQVLRVLIINEGSDPVSFGQNFKIERVEHGTGTPVPYKEADGDALITVAPDERIFHTINLDALENGRTPGRYQISQTFRSEKSSVEVRLEYAIGEEFDEVSYPVPPEMTPEHQEYYDKYLWVWGLENPFENDFSRQNPPREFEPFLLYDGCGRLEFDGDRDAYSEGRPFPEIPASEIHAMVARHFPITAEGYLAEVERMGEDRMYYNPQKDSYYFEGGYGGGGVYGVVTGSRREGDLLTLHCDWYGGWDDGPVFSNTVTIRLGEEKSDFFFLDNVVTARVR